MLVGAIIQAKLIEEVENDHWIVSFQGQLIQVRNTTEIQFKKNRLLNLKVISVKPFQLQVVSAAKNKNFKIDVRV